jgi:hypothetical protein
MVLNVKWYIGLVLGFSDKQEAILFYFLVQGWPQGEGIHKMRGLGWGNSWVQLHIVGMSPTRIARGKCEPKHRCIMRPSMERVLTPTCSHVPMMFSQYSWHFPHGSLGIHTMCSDSYLISWLYQINSHGLLFKDIRMFPCWRWVYGRICKANLIHYEYRFD